MNDEKKGAAKAPYGSHRSCLATEAARLFSQPIVAARLVLIRRNATKDRI